MYVLVIIVTMNHKLFALGLREPIIIVNATSSFIVHDLSIEISEVVENGSFEL